MFKESTKHMHFPRVPRDTAHSSQAGGRWPWFRFILHFGEMVVAMYAGMYLLDMPSGMAVSALGFASSDPITAALLMTATMTIPMVLWMWFRGHTWERSAEMGAAMAVPSILIVWLATAGIISRAGLSGAVMYPMDPGHARSHALPPGRVRPLRRAPLRSRSPR